MEYKVASTGAEWRAAPRVCRCCLSEGCYKDISTDYYWMGEKEMYADMLRECFDLTISLQDSASSSRLICEVCITRLRDACNFKKQVVCSEKRFAEHLRSGAKLETISASVPNPTFMEVKIEGVKDERVISDDDPDPVDDDTYDDPDYDESDSLPLKYEVQKKEALISGEFSFGDEIPTLSNTETTIRRVSSKSKDKAHKKLKINKKELTIKPVKAGGSKVKTAKTRKEPKVKAAKAPTKKGPIYEFLENSILKRKQQTKRNTLSRTKASPAGRSVVAPPIQYRKSRIAVRTNADTILEFSTAVPFRTGMSSLTCAYCGDSIADPALLRAHTREKHPVYNSSSVFYNLKKNQLIKVDLTDLACKLCSQRQADLSALKLHLKDVHLKKINSNNSDGLMPFALTKDDWRCYLCSHRFITLRSLNSHMGEHFHNYVCESCGRGFMHEHELQTHVRTHGNQTDTPPKKPIKRHECPHRCPKCMDRFKTYDARLKHMVIAHGMEQRLYKCLECPLTFKRRSARHIHMQSAHNCGNNFVCPQCATMFVTKAKRDEHVARHSWDGADSVHECSVCKKVYAQRKSLREHMKLHARDNQSGVFRQQLLHPDLP